MHFTGKNRQVFSRPQGTVGIRDFAVVHSSGTWHNLLVFSIVLVNPSPEELEAEQHPLSERKIKLPTEAKYYGEFRAVKSGTLMSGPI